MLGFTPKYGSKSKLAKHKRFVYNPQRYDPVKEDLRERKKEIKERLENDHPLSFHDDPKPVKSFSLRASTLRLVGLSVIIFGFGITLFQAQRGISYLGKSTEFISIGGIIIFALLFVRLSKK